MIVQWTKSSPLRGSMEADITEDTVGCRVTVFITLLTLRGTCTCTSLICLTMFLVVVLHKDIEQRSYKWGYSAFAVFYPLICSLVPAFCFSVAWDKYGECVVHNNIGSKLFTVPYFGFVASQIFCLVATMAHIRRTASSVSHHVSKNMPIVYVFLRFIATFFAQIVNVFPAQIMLIFPETGNSDSFYCAVIIMRLLGPMLDALVLLLGNVEFTEWVQEHVSRVYAYVRATYFPELECEKCEKGEASKKCGKCEKECGIELDGSKEASPTCTSSLNTSINKSDEMRKLESGVLNVRLAYTLF
eukprot:Phypoly_transcript_05253.p1 GENE.Phypoly_transcript_05253~~Phypoly_transcript_05253.p1  ORF type:complete len:301 (+),score=26.27 Phypoly_transcript_05253:935-1837(+)